MYSRNYGYVESENNLEKEEPPAQRLKDTGQKGEPIPVETFHDQVGEAEFQRMYSEPPYRAAPYGTPEAPYGRTSEEPPHDCETCPSRPPLKEEKKGPFGFLDGFFNNINFDDLIIVALIVMLLWDDNKDNDYITPVLLFLLLVF